MVLDAVSNFVRGNTDAAIESGDTTISVADASIFPDPATDGEFNVVIWNVSNFPRPDQDGDVEIVRVTGRDTGADELTVVRGQETTSDVAHPDGSAIHLSPTAKMFTDIEGTFTTEAEAADAAPVQSVFGRVGTVVAETGDYAATQISNFSSEVLTSISGSTIAPSEITDLWNGTVVTADVNNTNTTTQTLEAESLAIDDAYYYAGDDSELTTVLNQVSEGDCIMLGSATFSENRSLTGNANRLSIRGLGGHISGTNITGDWDIGDRTELRDCRVEGSVTISGAYGFVTNVYGAGQTNYQIDADEARLTQLRSGTVEFSSGTSGGLVDSSVETSVTDNGNNTIGDIS